MNYVHYICPINLSFIIQISKFMPNFVEHYKSLSWKGKSELNKMLLLHCDISYPTVYRKMLNHTFSKLEKEKISQLLNQPVEELFPKKEATMIV